MVKLNRRGKLIIQQNSYENMGLCPPMGMVEKLTALCFASASQLSALSRRETVATGQRGCNEKKGARWMDGWIGWSERLWRPASEYSKSSWLMLVSKCRCRKQLSKQ